MGFIEENIMDGENVIYRAKLHWVIFLLPGVFLLLFLLLFLQVHNHRLERLGWDM